LDLHLGTGPGRHKGFLTRAFRQGSFPGRQPVGLADHL